MGIGRAWGGSRPVPWRWAALAAVILAAAVGGGFALAGHTTASGTHQSLFSVARGTVSQGSSAAGTVTAVNTRGLSFSMAGTVTSLTVKAGDPVIAGQVLATIDSSAAQDGVTAATQQLSSATQALAQAEQTPAPAQTCTATSTAHNQSAPGATPTASPAPSHLAGSASPGSSPSTGRGGSGATTCATGGSGAGGGTGRGGQGSVFSAQQQVNNAELALVQADQRLTGTTIAAPRAATVLSIAGAVGSTESPGGTGFIVLGSLSDTEITAEFSEAGVANLAVGQLASIVLPDRGSQTYTGRVSEIDLAATTSGRLVRYGVRIAFDSVPAGLLYGESADVQVVTAHVDGVLYVPSSAVTGVQDGTGTVTVRTDGRSVARTVRIGLRGDRYTEIQSGLTLNDQVVLAGGG